MNTDMFDTIKDLSTEPSSLMNDLWRRSGLAYISDLKQQENRINLRAALLSTAVERYPYEEWNEAAHYLTGNRHLLFLDEQQAWECLYAMCTGDKT